MSQSRRYTWRAQPQRHALRHLTTINMFFFKTYTAASFEVKLQFVKVPCPLYVKCRLLHPANKSTEPPNHIHIHNTHTQTTHACSFIQIQSTIFTLSLFHKNEPSITTAIHHNHHPSSSTMHCTDHSVWHSYMHT